MCVVAENCPNLNNLDLSGTLSIHNAHFTFCVTRAHSVLIDWLTIRLRQYHLQDDSTLSEVFEEFD